MSKVEIRNKSVWVGKERITLISGEVHYWRLQPENWQAVLESVKELGIKVISTYVPWDYHELKREKYDFTGSTAAARDLRGFLKLTRDMGFWLVIRPGPYIYSEWPREGVPAYAFRYHRLHPEFQAAAKKYMAAVTKVIQPFFASRSGGHIILLQADNEIDPWPDRFGHQYGMTGKPGFFQKWIQSQYHGNIQRLNEAWGTRYKSFNQARPFAGSVLSGPIEDTFQDEKTLRRRLDYFNFKHEYSALFAEWVVEEYRKLGVDIPVYLNLYPFFFAHDWSRLQEVSDMVGLDLYPHAQFGEDEHEQRKFMDKLRLLRNVSTIPFIAEFASGVWHDRHYHTGTFQPNHYRLLAVSALAAGATGWNWYMLVNRDNWYMSPVNEWGRKREELYSVFQEITKASHELDPAGLTSLTCVGVIFNPMQHAAKILPSDSPLQASLHSADMDYQVIDPRNSALNRPILFYSGSTWLETLAQKRLKQYVDKGGILVVFQDFPSKDESFSASPILGFEEPSGKLFEFKKAFDFRLSASGSAVKLTSSVFIFESAGGEKFYANFPEAGRLPVGYLKKSGKGKILHLGFKPNAALMREILAYFKLKEPCYSVTPGIRTAVFQKGRRFYLLATNNSVEKKTARVVLPVLNGRRFKIRSLTSAFGADPEVQNGKVFFEIPEKDGRIFELSPA